MKVKKGNTARIQHTNKKNLWNLGPNTIIYKKVKYGQM